MLCFVFPGQGSQQPAMGAAFSEDPSWDLVNRASEAAGRDVAHLLLDADAGELVETRNAQLGTFVHSMVVLDALRRRGIDAQAAAGHSLGEFSALCAAGILDLDDAVRLVTARGDAMQVCTTQRTGTMAAVLGLEDDAVMHACEGIDGDVWVANVNAPGQVVVAGSAEDIEWVSENATDLGVRRVIPLKVAGAFHSSFMEPAADAVGRALSGIAFTDPAFPVWSNTTAQPHHTDQLAATLRSQVVSTVRFEESLGNMATSGISTFVHIGPGDVTAAMARRTVDGATIYAISELSDIPAVTDSIVTVT